MPDGRRRIGPCGCEQEAVIANFYVCARKNCDGRPACPNCKSQRVMPFSSPQVPEGSVHCMSCGKVFYQP